MEIDQITPEPRPEEQVPAMLAARPKRVKSARPIAPAEPVTVPIEADIAAVALLPVPAIAPVDLPKPAAVAEPVFTQAEEPIMATTAETVTHQTTETMNAGMTKGVQMIADMNARAKSMVERAPKLLEEMGDMNKANVEALVESGRIAARGMEAMGQHFAEVARRQFEGTTAAFRTLSAVKSPTEFAKVQADLTRTAIDGLVAETSRSTESMLKLVGEVVQPISNRVAIVADRMKTAA